MSTKIKDKQIPMQGKIKKANVTIAEYILENNLEKACTIMYSTMVTIKAVLIMKIAQTSDNDIIEFTKKHLYTHDYTDTQRIRTYLISRIAIEDGEEGLIDRHLVNDEQLRDNMNKLRKEQLDTITQRSSFLNDVLTNHTGGSA